MKRYIIIWTIVDVFYIVITWLLDRSSGEVHSFDRCLAILNFRYPGCGVILSGQEWVEFLEPHFGYLQTEETGLAGE